MHGSGFNLPVSGIIYSNLVGSSVIDLAVLHETQYVNKAEVASAWIELVFCPASTQVFLEVF